MSAKASPPDAVGSALAVQNSIGFFITVFSIQLTAVMWDALRRVDAVAAGAGPMLGHCCGRRRRAERVTARNDAGGLRRPARRPYPPPSPASLS